MVSFSLFPFSIPEISFFCTSYKVNLFAETFLQALTMASPAFSFESFDNIINGKPRSGASKTRAVDPSTGSPLWEVPVASKADLDDAVEAAKKAFPEWSRTTWKHRSDLLIKLRDLVLENKKELTELLLQEAGKPVCASSE